MMGKANYLGLVGGGRQPKFAANKLILWDDLKSKSGLEISALTPVRGVQLSKERVVVVLQNSVRVYKFAKPPSFVAAYETANNPSGLCCMSQTKIAFPGRTAGHVQLVEISTGNVSIIPAHSSPLRVIAMSQDGEFLATASEKGTLIRVFSTSNCARVVELRRGIDSATIFSLAFNPSGSSPFGTMLACTSDKSTLHIFDVPNPKNVTRWPVTTGASGSQSGKAATGNNGTGSNDGTGKWGVLSKIPLMPRVFSDVYSFASAPFEAGDEPAATGGGGLLSSSDSSAVLGTMRPSKGIIGWISEDTLIVVGAGQDARWEKFVVQETAEGGRQVVRQGWKRYLGGP